MSLSWITIYPKWYAEEFGLLGVHYPNFGVDERQLVKGRLTLYGNLEVRPTGGTRKYPVRIAYPEGTPFESPIVTPLVALPKIGADGQVEGDVSPRLLDHRHQMADGSLCLFQRDTRITTGGTIVRGIDALKRAELWLLGHHTGHWPPDCHESEIESHFSYATDVLMGETFFDPTIEGWGRFFLVKDFRRIIDARVQGLCPMIATALTQEKGVAKYVDARKDLAHLFPWIALDYWNPEKIIHATEAGNDLGAFEIAYWWSLPSEPMPFHNGRGLLGELNKISPDGQGYKLLSSLLRQDLILSEKHFFGFRYLGRHGSLEWLVLMMYRGKPPKAMIIKMEDEKRRDFEKENRIWGVRVNSVQPLGLALRNRGVVTPEIRERSVALIGLGALGSQIAELMAKAGVGRFKLCDHDTLSTGNVARHIGGLRDFGATKTRVVMTRLLDINPYLQFDETPLQKGSAVTSLENLKTFMASADITICTVADEGVESVVNQIAVMDESVVLYARSLRQASMGRVFLVRPRRDACKACLAHYAETGRAGGDTPPDWIDVPESESDVLLHECGRPVIAGSGIDMCFVGTLAARIALDYLEGSNAGGNHWIWSRRPEPELDSRFDRDFCVLALHLEPRPGCPGCQEPDVLRLVMTEQVRRTIVSLAESSPDVETGGVLIGSINEQENTAVIVKATGPGPESTRTKTLFVRDTTFVQEELNRAFAEQGSLAVYLGEWHSHLDPNPQPSPTDIHSLFGIALEPQYLTRCPVMIIAGMDPKTNHVAKISSWAFPVGGRMYSIDNVTQVVG